MVRIILFDGDCYVCNRAVQFVIKRDHTRYFKFASQNSKIGQQLLEKYRVPKTVDSLIVLDKNKYYDKSTAALHICKYLSWRWKLLYSLIVIPTSWRDFCYEFIAKNRYKWVGKNNSCQLISVNEQERFL